MVPVIPRTSGSGHEREGGRPPSRPPPGATRWTLRLSGRQSRPSGGHDGAMTSVVNINDVLESHVGLDLACIDRLFLNAYVPNLQVSGQVVTFLTAHLGFPIPSPALLQKIGNRFRHDVKAFAAEHDIPILQLKKPDRSRWDDRKLDHVRPYLDRAETERRFGVVAIVSAQEFAWVFSAKNRSSTPGVVSYDFAKEDRRVGCTTSTCSPTSRQRPSSFAAPSAPSSTSSTTMSATRVG